MAINPNLFAGLGPFAGLTQASTEALSRGIGGLFGIKDPEMEAQRAIAMAAQNPNDPTTLSNAANILAQAGKIDQAMALAGQARQITRQEQQFGLEQRRVAATEEQIKNQQLNQAARLALDEKGLELKKEELKIKQNLTDAQIEKLSAEIAKIDQGDYYIVEQKGGELGNVTTGFIAINKRNPEDRKTIPLVSSAPIEAGKPSVVPPKAAWQYVPGKGMVKNEDK
jgi:hypothetical protein